MKYLEFTPNTEILHWDHFHYRYCILRMYPYLSVDMVRPGFQLFHHKKKKKLKKTQQPKTNKKNHTKTHGQQPGREEGKSSRAALQDFHLKVCTNKNHQIERMRGAFVFQIPQLMFPCGAGGPFFSGRYRQRQLPIFNVPQTSLWRTSYRTPR